MADETIETVANEKNSIPSRERGGMATFFALVALLIAIGSAGFQAWQYIKIKNDWQRDIEKQSFTSKTNFQSIQQSMDEVKNIVQNAQNLSTKQEQMIRDWQAAQKGDLNKWQIVEAQNLVRLANDHIQFDQNTSLALTLLQRADQILENIQDANVFNIRKSLATDVANLQALPQMNMTQVFLKLTALNAQIDQLTLPFNPLQNEKVDTKTENTNMPWWKAGLMNSWKTLQKIVVVRRNDTNTLPLIFPEEKTFLYQNLHAQIENAIWGLLHHNNDIYQASLQNATTWINRYFVKNTAMTQSVIAQLQQLQQINIQPQAVDLSNTLQLFAAAQNTNPSSAVQ